ncbi:MAG: isochorismatase family protein [Planctomycetaceae bacterium]|jgi:nicotinamidase-related amidase|nr:isochorismatase family protein [Planctomycetaceae bacterium]
MKHVKNFFILSFSSILILALLQVFANAADDWAVHLRDRTKEGQPKITIENWNPKETAIIVCDMWAFHPCVHATARLEELAKEMNGVFDKARAKGILIVFAPSSHDIDKHYSDLPARKTSAKYRHGFGNPRHWDFWVHGRGGENEHSHLAYAGEKDAKWVLPNGDPNCFESRGKTPDFRQTPILKIKDNDILTDDFVEMIGNTEYKECLFKERGIKNVILMGVHTDMCVIGRPFGCRAMKIAGYNTALCRDLTDCAWNCASRMKDAVDHFRGLDKVVEYIETYICPTITSTDITGKQAFHFDEKKYAEMFPLPVSPNKKEIEKERGKIKVEIVQAFYGLDENNRKEVTKEVKEKFDGTRLIPIENYNTTFGDPNPGVVKNLWITYKINNKEKTQTFNENTEIILNK